MFSILRLNFHCRIFITIILLTNFFLKNLLIDVTINFYYKCLFAFLMKI